MKQPAQPRQIIVKRTGEKYPEWVQWRGFTLWFSQFDGHLRYRPRGRLPGGFSVEAVSILGDDSLVRGLKACPRGWLARVGKGHPEKTNRTWKAALNRAAQGHFRYMIGLVNALGAAQQLADLLNRD
jgi:hypothetical protein